MGTLNMTSVTKELNFNFLKDLFIDLFWEKESTSGEQEEKEREFQVDSMLSTDPNVGFDFRTLRSWLKPKTRVRGSTNCATQVLQNEF